MNKRHVNKRHTLPTGEWRGGVVWVEPWAAAAAKARAAGLERMGYWRTGYIVGEGVEIEMVEWRLGVYA